MVEQFMNALSSGDATQIMKFLSAVAVLFADGGGKVRARLQPLFGHIPIFSGMAANFKNLPASVNYRITIVNGLPGIVLYTNKKTIPSFLSRL
ncbi:hypothetical protein [Shimazuella soli]|uniref:hypothetical protein n=1 Tax=Shimazuella soli TaxID=1892854 RepID=UPI001F0D6F22|nr:hypothetical protein [Shimazuella soli]